MDAKGNNGSFGISNLSPDIDRGQRLQLEGNFNEYFDVYVPRGYERDALYVFTPDVMQRILDSATKYDIEIIDSDLYIYQRGRLSLRSGEQLKELLSIADSVREKIVSQSDYYADYRVNDRNLNVVAPQGARISQRLAWWRVVIVVIVIGAILMNILSAVLNIGRA